MEKKLSLYELAIDENIDGYEIDGKLITEEQLLNEDFIEYALMGAGFIPVIGEIFDTVLILRYCKQGRYLEAALMMIALIPTVGDIMVKPFLLLFKNSGKIVSIFTKKLAGNPAVKAKFTKLAGHIDDSVIDKFIAGVAEKNKSWGEALLKAKGSLKDFMIKLNKPGTTIKQGFQAKAAAKFAVKHGRDPKAFYKWWKGRRMSKSTMKKIIVGSNILSALGLPSFEAFEDKMNDPEFVNQVVNTPEYENIASQIENSDESQTNNPNQILSAINTEKGVDLLKFMSKFVPA